ncbi:MAG: D-2-hydroxyacid dehydrogenase [Candidatus Eisenbacteria bacterium]|nr:D-2-hydroxyacid dehydrogenase [Candidatus Eisenbacteria bacterium]
MKLVIAIYGDFPLWNYPEERVHEIEKVLAGGTVHHLKNAENLAGELRDSDIAFAWRIPREAFLGAQELKWVHCSGAGVTGLLFRELVESNCILTNSKGIQAIPISEHVFSLMLAYSRKINRALEAQLEGKWGRIDLWTQPPELGELFGKTIGIIGFGGIGKEVARRAKAFGMRVLAVRKTPDLHTDAEDSTRPFQTIGQSETLQGQSLHRAGGQDQDTEALGDEVFGTARLKEVLARSDYVLVLVPHTAETRGMFGEKEFRSMKKGPFFINVSRGAAVKEEALVTALKKGWIGGAGLDVFEKEPLPEGSELYRLPNVILTPHVAGASPLYWERVTALFLENLKRFLGGRPLLNLVDKRAGY